MSQSGDGRSWIKLGCLIVVAAMVLVAVVAGTLAAWALREIRSEAPETRRLEREPGAPADPAGPAGDAPRAPGRVELDVAYAQLVVTPAEAGEPVRVEAEYDPRYYELTHESGVATTAGWTYRVTFAPRHWPQMALLKIKLGARPPVVRVSLPRDLPLSVTGDTRGVFTAMELGGLTLETLDVNVDGGAATVSFLEPLAAPMERLAITGDKGSVEVTGLGNASPRETEVRHRLGELDLDLRGAWSRDAVIRLDASLAGGGVWLPDGVIVEGLDGAVGRRLGDRSREIPGPRLRFEVSARRGNLVFVDAP